MDALILATYALIVWLIFFKFKLLPWNTTSQVIVYTIPVVGMFTLIMLLNRYAPSSSDVRVIKYTIPIVPQVRGRVIEVPIEPNRPVKKGDVLFRIDPTPYSLQVKALEAQLANAVGANKSLREQLKAASAKTDATRAKLELARMRVKEHREMVAAGAGSKFELEAAEADLRALEGELAAASAGASQITEQLGAVVGGDQAQVAQIKAQLESARWDLSQTTVLSPADGTVVNLQLRPGGYVTAFPALAPISVVEDVYQIYALYYQNELEEVAPGDAAEIVLPTHPGEDHQGHGRFGDLGPGAGDGPGHRHDTADRICAGHTGALSRAPGSGRSGQGDVYRGRRRRRGRDLHAAPAAHSHHP